MAAFGLPPAVAIDGRTPSTEQVEAQIASLRMIALVIMTSSDMTSSDGGSAFSLTDE